MPGMKYKVLMFLPTFLASFLDHYSKATTFPFRLIKLQNFLGKCLFFLKFLLPSQLLL